MEKGILEFSCKTFTTWWCLVLICIFFLLGAITAVEFVIKGVSVLLAKMRKPVPNHLKPWQPRHYPKSKP